MSSSRAHDRNQRQLLELIKLAGNDRCADCNATPARWAVWNFGCFICVTCCSVHRKMGTDVSRVKSLTLDTWTTEQLGKMKSIGNLKSNTLLNPDPRNRFADAGADESERNSLLEKFIRAKYEKQVWRKEPKRSDEDDRGIAEERRDAASTERASEEEVEGRRSKPPNPTRANSLPVSYPTPDVVPPSSHLRADSPSFPPPRLNPVAEFSQPSLRPRAATTVEPPFQPPSPEKRFNASIWDDMGSLSLSPSLPPPTRNYSPSLPSPSNYGQPSTLYPTPGLSGVHTTNPFAASMGHASNPYFANGHGQGNGNGNGYAGGGGVSGVEGYSGYQQAQPIQHQFVQPQHIPDRPTSTNPFLPMAYSYPQGQQQQQYVAYNSNQQPSTNPFGPNYLPPQSFQY